MGFPSRAARYCRVFMEGLAAPFSIRESIFRVISSPHSARWLIFASKRA